MADPIKKAARKSKRMIKKAARKLSKKKVCKSLADGPGGKLINVCKTPSQWKKTTLQGMFTKSDPSKM